jgi:hypothetical protein
LISWLAIAPLEVRRFLGSVVSERVGHASPSKTMAVYQHVVGDDDRAAATAGANAIFRP